MCPLVEDSPKIELSSATAEHKRLRSVFSDLTVGLIHGQLPPRDKEGVMAAFRAGEIDVLVSTTVIEVGIDVPNATVMVIEDADRFGLSQCISSGKGRPRRRSRHLHPDRRSGDRRRGGEDRGDGGDDRRVPPGRGGPEAARAGHSIRCPAIRHGRPQAGRHPQGLRRTCGYLVLYYCDPTYHWSPLNQLKSALKDKISTSRLSVRVIADALDTSASQVARLLQENKASKHIVQLIRLAELAGYQIEFSLKKKRAA